MATRKQVEAAKRNVRSAQRPRLGSARSPISRRARGRELGKPAARGRARGGSPGHALEDRNREQLYELAKKRGITGRSKMGTWDLIRALRGS